MILTPDPINPEYALDPDGRLYVHTVMETKDGQRIDIGYSLAKEAT